LITTGERFGRSATFLVGVGEKARANASIPLDGLRRIERVNFGTPARSPRG
jgi:hypothetical protein